MGCVLVVGCWKLVGSNFEDFATDFCDDHVFSRPSRDSNRMTSASLAARRPIFIGY